MTEDIFDRELNKIGNDLFRFLEDESLVQIKQRLKSISKLQDEITEGSEKAKTKQTLLDDDLRLVLDIGNDGNRNASQEELVKTKLNNEKQELEAAKSELEQLRERKVETVSKMRAAEEKFDSLTNELRDIEKKNSDFQVSGKRNAYKLLANCMMTHYKLDPQARCISVILNTENSVERALLLDKENKSEDAVREETWSEFYKIYKATV